MVVARGTPYNHGLDSVTLRGQGENQLLARSEDDGASQMEDSSADVDDSASSSMGSNNTYGSVAALFFYEARKEGLAKAFKGGVHQESMPRFGLLWFSRPVEAAHGQQESGSADGTECRRGPAHGVRISSLRDAILISLYPELDDGEFENRFLGMKGSDFLAEHAGHVRLAKCQRERESCRG